MCGIVGYFGNGSFNLERARETIVNRGPDMFSIESGKGWRVAFNRLSIHDLSPNGMQPFEYEGVIVYLNGEIFNYIELLRDHREFIPKSRSDVEIVPYLYKKYGLEFLNMLNGMFAIVLIDQPNGKYYLIRDRFAEKPLYYTKSGLNLLFASEVKALKELKSLEIDKLNLKINFASWFLPQPLSLYRDTLNVNPGSYIEYSLESGDFIEKRWYNPTIRRCSLSESEIEEKFISLYKSSIDLRLRGDVGVGIFLSGGLDSTSIAKFAKDIRDENFFAFGADIVDKSSIEKNNTDIVVPKRLAREIGLDYYKTTIDYSYYNRNIVDIIGHFDEIFMNSGVLIFYALSKLAQEKQSRIVLTGIGGDELFGGYPWQGGHVRKIDWLFKLTYNKLPYSEAFSRAFIKMGKKIATAYQVLFDYYVWHAESLSSFRYDFLEDKIELEKRVREIAKRYFELAHRHLIDGDLYNIMGYANIFTVIGAGNHYTDIATMRYSIENRAPFLDYRLYEFLMSVPDEIKSKYGHKGFLRKVLKRYLPDYITEAKKSGPTMPINRWFYDNKELNSNIEKFLLKHIDIIEEYLSLDISRKVKSKSWVADRKNALKLFAILSFVIWAKFNITDSIKDRGITFEELLRYS
jgi:asparagine synthase (glutamine-hydrolysing)